MSYSIRAHIQLVSQAEVEKIERLDARDISSTPDKYVKENLLGYYVLINTWLMLIRQWSAYGWAFVLNYIKANGLFSLIRNFDEAAKELTNGVAGTDLTFSLARTIWHDVESNPLITGVPIDSGVDVLSDPLSAMLLLLRYGKRFSPLCADVVKGSAIRDFISTQRDLRAKQASETSQFVVKRTREAARSLINWDRLVEDIRKVDLSDMIFTPGVTFDTKADLVSKLERVVKERVEYFPIPFGTPLVCHPSDANEVEYWGRQHKFEVHCVRLSPVPKNYKTARVIAPEDVIRQALARRLFVICDGYLPDTIRLHDQCRNQDLAREGSIDGNFATIDLHAASDSITITTLYDILPWDFLEEVKRYLPTHYTYEGRRRLLQSAATMGNSMTFWLESVVFCSIARAAVDFYNRMSGNDDSVISIYGDDIIVPTDAAPTVIEWLEEFGFTVNTDKSFFSRDHRYRESCGVEYFEGRNLTSRYFPRFPLIGTLGKFADRVVRDAFLNEWSTTLTSLVDLQHKLYGICIPAALLVAEVIREAEPRMSTSTPDEGLNDIWSYESTPKVFKAPFVKGSFDGRDIPDYALRPAHLGPIYQVNRKATAAKSSVDREAYSRLLIDLYNYQQFLKYGPRYDTPLDRLLGVSAPPMSLEEASRTGEVQWAWIR